LYTLFISDLHLSEHTPAITAAFFELLRNQARQAHALYILGDLFEAWIGDDDLTPYHLSIINALQQLSTATAVYLMVGNRDFLLGKSFAKASGCQLLPDPTLIDLYGQPTLLAHGDLLCTQDKAHIAFRRMTQKPWLQHLLLGLPLSWRAKVAVKLRAQSRRRNKRLPSAMMDVNPGAIADIMRRYKVKQLIHGHTHMPSLHSFLLDGSWVKRVVLNDWDEGGGALLCLPNGEMRLTSLTYL
jgi:UDP-2,3-diacylglucosamine hydrolase